MSLAGEDALIAQLGPDGSLAETDLFGELSYYCQNTKPVLVVLDTLADLFGGDENNRTQARRFIGICRHLAIETNCAVVLIAHPSLSGMASGRETSGSTAWDGSVRSRIYMETARTSLPPGE